MPASAQEQVMAACCTCGHHYGRAGAEADTQTTTATNATLRTTPQQGSGSSSNNNSSPSQQHQLNHRPLDASFVQVPHYPQHPYDDPYSNSYHSSLSLGSTSNKQYADPQQQQQQQEEEQKRRAFLTGEAPHSEKAESYRRLGLLQKAAMGDGDGEPPPSLCPSCVQRVEQALLADTDRLYAECQAYRDAVREDKARIKGWRQAIQGISTASSGISFHDDDDDDTNNDEGEEVLSGSSTIAGGDSSRGDSIAAEQSTEEAFRNEIALLEEACQQHRDELLNFRALQREQKQMELELDRVHDAIAQEQNALELEARAFDNDQEQLSRALLEIQDEVERLSSPKICLPSTLWHLQVDMERGLRYPLINQLRLAYRPKGDIQWKEIQAAWALAAQLLLSIGTLFQFQSQNWKLVPLSHCAKLFYYPPDRGAANDNNSHAHHPGAGPANNQHHHHRPPVVFNLGHPKTNQNKALLTWNALLCQMIQHVKSEMNAALDLGILDDVPPPPVPFDITPTTIGNTSLTQLDENDDGGWSRVIHFMSSNLLWLSDCASTFVRQQVVLATPTTFSATGGDAATAD